MPRDAVASNHGPVTTTAPAVRRLYRASDHGILGGVAAGIAEHLGVRPRLIRFAFIALAISGGLGVALYGTYWIVLPARPGAARSRLPTWLEYVIGARIVSRFRSCPSKSVLN